ncbi:MAG: hypothetical protein E6X72_00510 [Clostridioides difficile]|nr:hypothetical protein [Clostridioides difficile]
MSIENLTDVLLELKNVSINSSPDAIKIIMNEYNMLFLGSKFNTIYSEELRHCLNKKFNYIITTDELNTLLLQTSKILNMKLKKLIPISDIENANPKFNYEITLWE